MSGDRSAQAHYETAQGLHRQGHFAEAERHYRRVLEIYGEYAAVLMRLGDVCLQQQHYEDAAAAFERAAKAAPQDPAPLNDLGNLRTMLGQPEQALGCFRRAITLSPNSSLLHYNLGAAMAALSRHEDAVTCYGKAISLDPAYAAAYNNRGTSLNALQRQHEAVPDFEKARQIDPKLAFVSCNLGNALYALGRSAEALAAYEEARAIDPSDALAHSGAAHCLGRLGRFEEARRAFAQAITQEPKVPSHYRALVQIQNFCVDSPELQALEEMVREEKTYTERDRIDLHFALAKVYGGLGRVEEAFSHLSLGCALKRRDVTYDEAKELSLFHDTAAAFPAAALQAKAGGGDPSEVPVFIVGMPRSGTTLVEQILASHPDVFGGGELAELGLALSASGWGVGDLPYDASHLTAEMQRMLASKYLSKVTALAPEAKHITDKLPANFLLAGMIHLMFPRGHIVHVRRDPMDTCFSCFETLFEARNLPFSYDLGEIGRYYRAYEELMAHWRAVLPEGAMLEVQYADLVNDFEAQARRIVAYCGLEWNDRCLRFHTTQRSVHTVSLHQVRQPVYKSAVGRWRPYAKHLGPLVDALR